MKLRSNSPLTVATSMFDSIQDSIGPRIHSNYILMIEAKTLAPKISKALTTAIQEIVSDNATINPNELLNQLGERFDRLTTNPYIQHIFDEKMFIAEDMIELSTSLDSFVSKISSVFNQAFKDIDPIKSKVKRLEYNDNIIANAHETHLLELANELEKLFPIFQRNDPDKQLKLLAILYQSYVKDTSLFQNSTYEVDGRKIRIDFKHIEQLKFIKKLQSFDLSSLNKREQILTMDPIEEIDFEECRAIEWMPNMISCIEGSDRNSQKINAQLLEIETLCQEYANQFISWMILSINDCIEKEVNSDSELVMPFGDDPLYGIETLAEIRPATPIEAYQNAIFKSPTPVPAISMKA